MSPILDLQRRLHEAGRIRIGVQVPANGGKTRPKKLETFRVTGQDKRALDAVAGLYGGEVRPWTGAPVGEQFEVITDTAEIRVAIPPERMSLSQSYELWSGGGCVRRCDGQRQQTDEPCLCATLDTEDTKTPRCSRHTRLSLMLADLATTGLWRLDTQGFYASEELAGAFSLAQMISEQTGRTLLPGWLRLEQREIKRPGQPTRKFAVPVLDLDVQMAQLLGQGPAAGAQQLPPAVSEDGEIIEIPDSAQADTGPRGPAAELGSLPPAAGLTPIPTGPPATLAEELAKVSDPDPAPARKNRQAPIPDPGIDPRAAARASTPVRSADDLPAVITDAQLKRLMVAFTQAGITGRDDRLLWANEQIGRTIESARNLTRAEASALIEKLDALSNLQAANPDVDPASGP